MEFVEPEDEPGHFRNPLPPEDRLWRHPSEVGAGHAAGGSSGVTAGATAGLLGTDDDRPSMWLVAAVSAVSAGLLATGLALVVVGLIGNDQLRPVVERQMEPRPIDAVSGGDVAAAAARVRPALVRLRRDGKATAGGSGIIFRSDGHVLTSASVVGSATSLLVTLDNGREITGRVVGSDPATDTAVVKIDGDAAFTTAVLGTATDLQVGQPVVAMGCPVELPGGPSVTVGVISALHRSVPADSGGTLYDLVQTDARVPTGWPGGALLDSSGSVLGITTAAGTTVTGSGGFGFAVPIDLARSVADQLIATGRVGVWLGVNGKDIDADQAAELEIPGGAMVAGVMSDSPAERVGLAEGDVVVGVGGMGVGSMGQLVVALHRHRPGDAVGIDIIRDHQLVSMVVVLVERPDPA